MDDDLHDDAVGATPDEHTYSVGELADAINGALRDSFDGGVWVRGEIQGWNGKGTHAYFKLAEVVDDRKATISVSFFAPHRNRLKPLLERNGVTLADGLKVRIFGVLDFYAPSGSLGLKMSNIDPRFTLGELALERELLMRRLAESGLLRRNAELELPVAPLRIGLVTSVGSAAYADFTDELARSGLGFRVQAVDVRVQGDTAPAEIGAAVRALGRRTDLDVVVVIRGGGSKSDLAAFDDERVALAIAECGLPVFTGIGHEIDRAVADEVAHTSRKTPTACAGALVEQVRAFIDATEGTFAEIGRLAQQQLGESTAHVTGVARSIRARVQGAVERGDERLDTRAARLQHGARRVVERAEQRLTIATDAMRRVPRRVDHDLRHLEGLGQRVRLLDPAMTMARGWSITRTADGRTIRSADDLSLGDEIVTTFAQGTARSRVEETRP